MTIQIIKDIIIKLSEKGISFERGLTNGEISQIETKFKFKFPPDIKLFYEAALPVSEQFINWRLGLDSKVEAEKIFKKMNWPLEGVLFDVINNDFWEDSWEQKPGNQNEIVKVVEKHFSNYPKLIPIYSHRYIPEMPTEQDNPVFSVYQTDIVCYGHNLEDYFAKEFNLVLKEASIPVTIKAIEFWGDFL